MASPLWCPRVVVLLALVLVQPALAHVCPPCVCDVLQKRSTGYAVSTCAEQAAAAVLSTNRTLQLLEVIAAKSSLVSGCRVDRDTLQPLLDKAHSTHIDNVIAADEIVRDIKSFESSSVAENAAEYDFIMHEKLVEMGAAAFESSASLGKSVGSILSSCFQETPLPLKNAIGVPEVSVVTLEQLSATTEKSSLSEGNVGLAWGLTLIAGLSTILGATLVGVIDGNNVRLLSFMNALTAGVMIQGSIAGLGTEAMTLAAENIHPSAAFWIIFLCFFGGAGICVLLEIIVHKVMGDAHDHGHHAQAHAAARDVHVSESRVKLSTDSSEDDKATDPESLNSNDSETVPAEMPAEAQTVSASSLAVEECCSGDHCHSHGSMSNSQYKQTKQSVIVLVAGVTLHNVAEGMATFIAALANKRLGVAIAIAMVLHNIPEGFAIALPWYQATGSRLQGFLLSAVAGFAEILSAFVIYLVILMMEDLNIKQTMFACMFAIAGGMMTFIALHELYPGAVRMTTCNITPTAGMFVGLMIMELALGGLGIPK